MVSSSRTAAIAALNDFKNSYGEVNGSKLAIVLEQQQRLLVVILLRDKQQSLMMEDSFYVYTCATDDGTADRWKFTF